MRTAEVVQEFRDKCKELAETSKVPQVKIRLHILAHRYERQLDELDRVESASITPE